MRWALAICWAICSSNSSREEVAELVHEFREHLVGVLSSVLRFEHLVELGVHVLHAGHVFGRHVIDALLHLAELLLHQLVLELLHELLELLTSFFRNEVVVLQLLHPTGKVRRKEVERKVLVRRHRLGRFLTTLITRLACLVDDVLDGPPLLLHDLFERFVDLVVDATEIVAIKGLLASLAELLQHFAQALNPIAVAVVEALLQHLAQRGVDVTVIEEIIVELSHDLVGVEIKPNLGSVPAGVGESTSHGESPVRSNGGSRRAYRPR
jgi:hypothetical protein